MADGKLDLPDDLLPSKIGSDHFAKDEAWDRNLEEKGLTGLLDDNKDQPTSESSIPLSPQWLYSKVAEAKTLTVGASGDTKAPNLLPHGTPGDPNLKDSWRLDSSQDKKEWRRTAPDLEGSRHWREEERETSLLGRRDRRKEDRRTDISSTMDVPENRTLLPSERRQDVSNRSSGHESRRGNKWSSRWGLEDKEKDSRNEKRTDAKKEDAPSDKHAIAGGGRTAFERENDSRDKWRPRHRLEVHAGGSASYRSAPGFGLERGRVERSNVGFAAGRGRPNSNGSLQIGRPQSASVIGALPVDKNMTLNAYSYPRGKLLDMYRKQRTAPNFDNLPDEMDHLSTVTQKEIVVPLAFVPPDAEEEAVLGDIWKGKTISSEVVYNSFMDASEGKECFSVNMKDSVEPGEKAAVNNNFEGSHAETFYVSDSQMIMSKEMNSSKEGVQRCMPPSDVDVTNALGSDREMGVSAEMQDPLRHPASHLSIANEFSKTNAPHRGDELLPEAWSDDHRRSAVFNPNIHLGTTGARPLSHRDQEHNGLDLVQHLMSQKLPNEPLQEKNNFFHGLPHSTGFAAAVGTTTPAASVGASEAAAVGASAAAAVGASAAAAVGASAAAAVGASAAAAIGASAAAAVGALQRHLLSELQNNSQASRHLDPSLEQIIQAKINQSAVQGQQADFLDFMSQAKYGNMLPLEHQLRLQREQFQVQQLSRALSQQLGIEEDRQLAGSLSVDEVGQFVRNPGIHPQAQSMELNGSDLHQKRLSSFEEQISNIKRNQALREQQQRVTFDPSPTAFARSAHSAAAPGMKVDNVNSLDLAEHLYMHSNNQLGPFSSGNHTFSQQTLGDAYASRPDLVYHSGKNEQLENSWGGKQMQQLNLEADLQRRESEVDSSTWASAGGIHEKSKKALMDLLHQKLGIQSTRSSEGDYQYSTSSSRGRESFWPVSEPQASHFPFTHFSNQEVHVNNSYLEGPQNSNSGALLQDHLFGVAASGGVNQVANCERMPHKSNPGSFAEDQSLLLGAEDLSSSSYADASLVSKSAVDKELGELEGKEKKNGLKSMLSRTGSVSGSEDNILEQVEMPLDCADLQSRTHIRHDSLSTGGNGRLYSNEIGLEKSVEDPPNDLLSGVPKGVDKVAQISSSQDVFSDQNTVPFVKQKSLTSQAKRTVETEASGKIDVSMRRTSSYNEAALSEASFMEILKKPALHGAEVPVYGSAFEPPSSDGASQAGRSGKKKGKKGRQIDPALLGFKVTSNRILMGEIQRLDD
ncbi:hypothetical protein GOBAR_AA20515 [Gossypium barbadense]|uniref:GYF domain-containing protein n=1 Tax=Gossypium barbadense TaxID=3634 RepID=A0A2P5X9Y5_GOSBA|nr:hypothetical protein GOBAR_AA20515 [Gossypium barbadense]